MNHEIEVTSTIPKMESMVREESLKDRLSKYKNKANIQLQRLEEICDVYDIQLFGRSSIEVETLLNQLEDITENGNRIKVSERDVLETAREMEIKENITLTNALKLAEKLGYNEAAEILRVSVSAPKFFYNSTN